MPPGAVSAAGTYYVGIRASERRRRRGSPSTAAWNLAGRADHRLELPHARRRRGSFSVGAFDVTTLLPESYSSEGPTDDGRLKPDIAAPTNVLITPGDPESDAINACGGTSCAAPHVGGAAALLWGEVAADGGAGSVAQRVRDRLSAQALDVGAPGADTSSVPGACGSTSRHRVLGAPTPAPGSLVRGVVALSLPLGEAGTFGLGQLTVDGAPLAATLAPGGIVSATWPTAGLPAGPHELALTSDQSGNVATYRIPCASTTRRRGSGSARPSARGPAPRCASRPPCSTPAAASAGRPRIAFGDGKANGFPSPIATSARVATSSRSARSTARATSPRCAARSAYVPFQASEPEKRG